MASVLSKSDFTRSFLIQNNALSKVRSTLNPATGEPMNHVYEFLGALGVSYDTGRKALCSFIEAAPKLRNNFPKLHFEPLPGSKHNQASWAASGETLYHLALSLKDRYSKPFKDFAVKCGMLTIGGSEALKMAVDEAKEM